MRSNLGLKGLFGVVVGSLLLGFLICGAIALNKLELLRVHGPLYHQVAQGKDLVADILPPPAYIIEAQLTLHEIVGAPTEGERRMLLDRFRTLQQAFQERETFWRTQPLPDDINHAMQTALFPSGNHFFEHTLVAMTHVAQVVKDTQKRARQNGEAIEHMAGKAHESTDYSRQIAQASLHQIDQLELLDKQISSLFNAINSNSSTLDLIHLISDSLYKTVQVLEKKIAFFTIRPLSERDGHPNEKRRFERSHNGLLVNVRYQGKSLAARTQDFSIGGMLLMLTTPLAVKVGDTVELEVKPPVRDIQQYLRQPPVMVKARIVRMAKEGRESTYAVAFENLSTTAQQTLTDALAFYGGKQIA